MNELAADIELIVIMFLTLKVPAVILYNMAIR